MLENAFMKTVYYVEGAASDVWKELEKRGDDSVKKNFLLVTVRMDAGSDGNEYKSDDVLEIGDKKIEGIRHIKLTFTDDHIILPKFMLSLEFISQMAGLMAPNDATEIEGVILDYDTDVLYKDDVDDIAWSLARYFNADVIGSSPYFGPEDDKLTISDLKSMLKDSRKDKKKKKKNKNK